MAGRLTCPKCGSEEILINGTLEGATAKCGGCGAVLRIKRTKRPDATSSAPVPQPARGAADRPAPAVRPAVPLRITKSVYSGSKIDPKALLDVEAGVPLEWKPGDVILDIYEVTKVHARGGMGFVYRVRHRVWNVDLAVKSPRPEIVARAGGPELFKREAETWSNLGLHPHIVSCYYVRNLGGVPRVFAEYVHGGSLYDWIRDRRLYEGGPDKALKRILDVCIQFAWGLNYAHRRGLVNQDVKPANVMMTPEGVAKVTDFGLAGAKPQSGTPAYRSPEQEEAGAKRRAGVPSNQIPPMTPATDIWSWGVSVLEMFTGELTWASGLFAPEILDLCAAQEPSDPMLPRMPAEVVDLLRRCFREDPRDRPAGMSEIEEELRRIYPSRTGVPYTRVSPTAILDTADSLNNRAVSMLDLGHREDAERLWDKALHVEPHHPQSSYNRGVILWRSARITDTALVGMMMKMGLAQGDNWIGQYLMALVQMERADFDAAVHILKRITWEAVDQEVRSIYSTAKKLLASGRGLLGSFDGHQDEVTSVCLSSDGGYALSGSKDTRIKLWETSSGRCVKTFVGHNDPVEAVAVTGDGRFGLSAGGTKIQIWELATGQCLREMDGHNETIRYAGISSDGRLAFSQSDYELKVWDLVRTGRMADLERDYAQEVLLGPACITGDGGRILSARGAQLRLWEVKTGKCTSILSNSAGKVESLAVSLDGRFAVTGTEDGTISLWDLSIRKCLRTIRSPGGKIDSLSISRNGLYAVAAGEGTFVRLWELESGRCLRTLEGHTGVVKSVFLTPDANYAASGGRDKTVRVWSTNPQAGITGPLVLSRVVSTEHAVTAQTRHEIALIEAASCMERGDLISAIRNAREARSLDGYERNSDALRAWHQLHLRLPRAGLKGAWEDSSIRTGDVPGALCIAHDGLHALSGGSATLRLWDLESADSVREFKGHEARVSAISLSQDGKYALSGSADMTLRLWDVATGRCIRVFQDDTEVRSVSLTHDAMYAVSASGTKLKQWDVETGRCLRELAGHPGHITSLSLSLDGRYAISAGDDATLRLWVLATGQCMRTFSGHMEEVTFVCFLPDARHVLSGSGAMLGGELKLWEVETRKCLRTFHGHNDPVSSISVSLDGRFALVSGGSDSVMKLWDVFNGVCLQVFSGRPAAVACLSLDSLHAVSSDLDGDIKRWTLDWDLEERHCTDWDDGALPFLEIFLGQRTPYAGTLSAQGTPSQSEIWKALTRKGKPSWSQEDFNGLLHTLGCAGYGWLTREGVGRKLKEIASSWKHPRPLL